MDAGAVSWTFDLPEPTVTIPAAFPSGSVTITIPHAELLDQVGTYGLLFIGNISLGNAISADGMEQILADFALNRFQNGRIVFGLDPGNTDFTQAMETSGSITVIASDGSSIVIMGIGDSTEPYTWTPANAAATHCICDCC